MSQEPLAPELRSFLLEHVESFEQLELLLLLGRERNTDRTAVDLAAQLRIPVDAATEALQVLCQRGLLVARGSPPAVTFLYQPREARFDAAVGQLGVVYTTHRLEVMRAMSANAVARLRGAALRAFTGSFLLRPGKKETQQDKEKNDG